MKLSFKSVHSLSSTGSIAFVRKSLNRYLFSVLQLSNNLDRSISTSTLSSEKCLSPFAFNSLHPGSNSGVLFNSCSAPYTVDSRCAHAQVPHSPRCPKCSSRCLPLPRHHGIATNSLFYSNYQNWNVYLGAVGVLDSFIWNWLYLCCEKCRTLYVVSEVRVAKFIMRCCFNNVTVLIY